VHDRGFICYLRRVSLIIHPPIHTLEENEYYRSEQIEDLSNLLELARNDMNLPALELDLYIEGDTLYGTGSVPSMERRDGKGPDHKPLLACFKHLQGLKQFSVYFYWPYPNELLEDSSDEEDADGIGKELIDELRLFDLQDSRTWELETYAMGDQHPNRSAAKVEMNHGRWLSHLDLSLNGYET
jgi:hypothetical protein